MCRRSVWTQLSTFGGIVCYLEVACVVMCLGQGCAFELRQAHYHQCAMLCRVMLCCDLLCRGMVESAFEFADICRKHDYHNFVFSMKASNPLVMVQAYRLLAEEMYKKGWDYPLHLGVTGTPGGGGALTAEVQGGGP